MKNRKKEMTQIEVCRSCLDYPCTMAVQMGIMPEEKADLTENTEVNAAAGTDITDVEMEHKIMDLYNEILKVLAEDESAEAVERQMVNDMVYLCTLAGTINKALYYLATGRMDPVSACQHGSAAVRTADRVLENWQMYFQNQK